MISGFPDLLLIAFIGQLMALLANEPINVKEPLWSFYRALLPAQRHQSARHFEFVLFPESEQQQCHISITDHRKIIWKS